MINAVVDILIRVGHFLNYYANLLLVLITAVYAWLTWRSLTAFRESTLRDREARHLQEIKDNVVQPIVSWISGTVLDRFTGGKSPGLLTTSAYDGKPRQVCHKVDDPFVARRSLSVPGDPDVPDPLTTWNSTESGRISQFLYGHTKQEHFPKELRQFDRLLACVRKLTGTVVSLANECAKDIAASEIPQAQNYEQENAMSEWTNPHLLAVVCIESLLMGELQPRTQLQTSPGFHLLLTTHNDALAKAAQADKLKHWCELGFEKIRRRWEGGNLPKDVRNLLRNAVSTRQTIDQLMFTHSLGVDCDLISGKTRR
jgi:hypothetical protein